MARLLLTRPAAARLTDHQVDLGLTTSRFIFSPIMRAGEMVESMPRLIVPRAQQGGGRCGVPAMAGISDARRRFGGKTPRIRGWIDGRGRGVSQLSCGRGSILGRLAENGRFMFLSAVP
jgi:hypothetical protein